MGFFSNIEERLFPDITEAKKILKEAKRQKQCCQQEKPLRQRRFNHWPKGNPGEPDFTAGLIGGVCCPQEFRLYNALERYSRFLELYIQFEEYHNLPEEEKQRFKREAEEQDAKSDEAWRKQREDEANGVSSPSSGHTTIAVQYTKEMLETMTFYTIPTCTFGKYGCGCAPCGCEESYQEYLLLRKKFLSGHGHINSSVHAIIEKIMDKDANYIKVVN